MAIFRKIHTEFWRDPKVLEELTPEDKIFFLYLLTNPNTTQIGIYPITKKQISFEIGYSTESVNALIDRFENHHKLIKYNEDTREIAIRNWGKYNLDRGGKPFMDCIDKELKAVKDKSLINYVGENIEKSELKTLFDKYINLDDESYHVSYHDSSSKSGQEKEEEKEKDKEKEEQKEKEKHIIQRFVKLYEQNIGLVNGVASEWLIDVSKYVDIKLFKRAIEIATNNGKCNKGYVSGILKQWESKNIKTYSDLKAYEVSVKNTGGNDNGTNNNISTKNRYAEELKSEDNKLYRKPTKEQLEQARKLFEEF